MLASRDDRAEDGLSLVQDIDLSPLIEAGVFPTEINRKLKYRCCGCPVMNISALSLLIATAPLLFHRTIVRMMKRVSLCAYPAAKITPAAQ